MRSGGCPATRTRSRRLGREQPAGREDSRGLPCGSACRSSRPERTAGEPRSPLSGRSRRPSEGWRRSEAYPASTDRRPGRRERHRRDGPVVPVAKVAPAGWRPAADSATPGSRPTRSCHSPGTCRQATSRRGMSVFPAAVREEPSNVNLRPAPRRGPVPVSTFRERGRCAEDRVRQGQDFVVPLYGCFSLQEKSMPFSAHQPARSGS